MDINMRDETIEAIVSPVLFGPVSHCIGELFTRLEFQLRFGPPWMIDYRAADSANRSQNIERSGG